MGEALGKTQVSSSAPTVNEHNQAYSVITQTVRKETYCCSPQAGGVPALSTLWRTEASARAPPNYGWVLFPLFTWHQGQLWLKGRNYIWFLEDFINIFPLLQQFKATSRMPHRPKRRLWAQRGENPNWKLAFLTRRFKKSFQQAHHPNHPRSV